MRFFPYGSQLRLAGGAFVRACHPEPTLAVTTVATLLAVAVGRGPVGCVLVALAILTGQLSIGWCNDTVDRDRDRISGRADKPVALGVVSARATGTAAGLALAACVPLSLASGVPAGLVHLAAVASAWAYDLGVKRTRASWLPYAVSFGLLPAFVTLGLPRHPLPPPWALLGGSLLGVGAHFANVLPDLDDDLATGVHGLPQRIGARWSRRLAIGCLVGASLLLAFGPPGGPDVAGTAGLGATALAVLAGFAGFAGFGRRGGAPADAPFKATLAVAVIDVALLLARGHALA